MGVERIQPDTRPTSTRIDKNPKQAAGKFENSSVPAAEETIANKTLAWQVLSQITGKDVTKAEGLDVSDGLTKEEAARLGISNSLFELIAKKSEAEGSAEDQILDADEVEKISQIISAYAEVSGITEAQAYELYNSAARFETTDLEAVAAKQAEAAAELQTKFSAEAISSNEFKTWRNPPAGSTLESLLNQLLNGKTRLSQAEAADILKKEIVYQELISKLEPEAQKKWFGYIGVNGVEVNEPTETQPGGQTEQEGDPGQTAADLPAVPQSVMSGDKFSGKNLLNTVGVDSAKINSLTLALSAYRQIKAVAALYKDAAAAVSGFSPADLRNLSIWLTSKGQVQLAGGAERYVTSKTPKPGNDTAVPDEALLAIYRQFGAAGFFKDAQQATALPADDAKIQVEQAGKTGTITGKQLKETLKNTYLAALWVKKFNDTVKDISLEGLPVDYADSGNLIWLVDAYEKAKKGEAVPDLDLAAVQADLDRGVTDKQNWYPRLALVLKKQGKDQEAGQLLQQTDQLLTASLSALDASKYEDQANLADVYFLMSGIDESADYLKKGAQIYKDIWPQIKSLAEEMLSGQNISQDKISGYLLVEVYFQIFKNKLETFAAQHADLIAWAEKVAPLYTRYDNFKKTKTAAETPVQEK